MLGFSSAAMNSAIVASRVTIAPSWSTATVTVEVVPSESLVEVNEICA